MDKIYRGILNKGKIRIFYANTSFSCQEICEKHGYNFVVSDALSRVLSIASIMGVMQKMGDISIRIDSNGPIKAIIVYANSDGHIRGLVSNPNIDDSYSVAQAVGELGILSVVKDFGLKRNFTSQIELSSGKIGDDFSYYFKESEQVPSYVNVGTCVEKGKFFSGALIVQLMPGYKDEDLLYVENFSKNCPNILDILKIEDKDVKETLKELFPEIEILDETNVCFKCNCSKEKFIDSLLTLDLSELEDMKKDDKDYELVCSFCNSKYYISPNDLEKIIERKKKQ